MNWSAWKTLTIPIRVLGQIKKLSIHIVDQVLLVKANCSVCISSREEDKSELFAFVLSNGEVPMDCSGPVVMECSVEDIPETGRLDNFICTIGNTYAEENVLTEKGQLNYHTPKPALFEMPKYLKIGHVLAKCISLEQNGQA